LATVRDFIKVWQGLNTERKDRALRFLMREYGRNLLVYMRFIDSDIEKKKDDTREIKGGNL